MATAIQFTSDSFSKPMAKIGSGWETSTNDSFISFNTTNDDGVTIPERMRINRLGNVGIGTAGPAGLLHLQAASGSNNMVFGTTSYPTTYRAKILHEEGYDGSSASVPLVIAVENSGTYYNAALFGHGQNSTAPSLKTYYTTILAATSGNVGIGTTGPGSKLQVNGTVAEPSTGVINHLALTNQYNGLGVSVNDFDLFSYGNFKFHTYQTTGTLLQDVMTIASTGNVGIGTTNPLQKLHVEGQCVTGDTMLPIRRRRRKKNSQEEDSTLGNVGKEQNSEIDGEWEYLMIPIIDIKPGDEVLSLNKNNGLVEYHSIKGLMDMGVKDVYELKTKSGRVIRTTANHPYLVKILDKKTSNSNQKSVAQKLTNITRGRCRRQRGLFLKTAKKSSPEQKETKMNY
ncbi:MAG: hypothetical protein US12_C0045G0006 [Parcubacteria group bacterium GW2011_GWA2_36_24]|nr:MAG: hypothetical protein US12_C0045G0006 [Parcubacteria group bacterium GW2011_GWA2_36_24]